MADLTRRRCQVFGAVLVTMAAVTVAPAPVAAAASSTVVTLRDPRLVEVSGIARGLHSPGVFYVQNDSGDSARLFAVDAHTGRVRAVYQVPGATNVDWEDIAVAPDAAGVPSIWIGDIGDNNADRAEVRVYRVDEPRVAMDRYDVHARTDRPDIWRLRYPNGAANAESLAVSPDGRAYIFTKSDSGDSVCYEVPAHPDPANVQVLRPIGTVRIRARTSSFIPADLQQLATGAAISPSGTVLALRTYTDAFLWRVDHGDVAQALRTAPRRLSLPLQPQGEGIGFDAESLVVDSEGHSSQVLAVALPPEFRPHDATPSATGIRTSGGASSRPDSSTGAGTQSQTPPPASGSAAPAPSDNHIDLGLGWRIVIAVVSIGLGCLLLARMIARRRRRPPT
jgi:hypothetical protein